MKRSIASLFHEIFSIRKVLLFVILGPTASFFNIVLEKTILTTSAATVWGTHTWEANINQREKKSLIQNQNTQTNYSPCNNISGVSLPQSTRHKQQSFPVF